VKALKNLNRILRITAGTFGCLLVFSGILDGQVYSFKNYGAESNIPSGFIYTINQSDDRYLWIGTGNGITRFDGFDFQNVPYPDSGSVRFATSSLKDRRGTLWFGCSDGAVFYVNNNELVNVPISNSKSISVLLEGPDSLVYIIPQGKSIFRVNPVNPAEIHEYHISAEPVMLSAAFTKSGSLLIGTQENLLECRLTGDTVLVAGVIKDLDYSNVTSIFPAGNGSVFIIGTDGGGLFHLKMAENSGILKRFRGIPELESASIRSITADTEKDIWVSTSGSGIFRLSLSADYEKIELVKVFDKSSGLPSNEIRSVFQDYEGNYWIGFFGEGISMLESYAFSFYAPGKIAARNNVIFINSLNDKYILGTPSGFHTFNAITGKSEGFTDLTGETGSADITSYYLDSERNLWIGTGGKGLFLRNYNGLARLFFRSGDYGSDFIKDIQIDGNNIWLATTNGVIILDRRSGNEIKRFDISRGLPHNSINKIYISGEGVAYIGTETERIYTIDRNFELKSGNAVMSGNTQNRIYSFARDSRKIIWAATWGNGIFRCFNDSVSAVNMSDNLMSNYCYSILADSENEIWIGHQKGFSRYNPETGRMRIYGTDFARGGVCNPNAVFESADRKVFIGTSEGLILYDRAKDRKKKVPPYNNINYITINDVKYPYLPSFTLPYSKKYVIKVDYVGINLSDPGKVYYKTFVQNYDNDWSRLTAGRELIFSLTYGTYRFNMMSVNDEGLSQGTPLSFDMVIKQPYWRRWWFVLASSGAATALVILIIGQREKAQKRIQDYLEKELAARTSVVLQQKQEIELQNIEITDSINYAKRIQSSILPDIAKLKESFRDAFILFHPRDIVSGDFYWFDRIDDEKFMIVCADSTGHGVPGAFMSMIGSTILQDIVTRQKISKPSEILKLLDKRVFSTLNQNVELGVSNDGMDVVVCEINAETRHIRFASAMRPVIIVLDGEPFYIKGNRISIGGESVVEKFFDDQEYYLDEGDSIYFFSDGLPDQFGGTDGKKMKISRLKKLIEQICNLPMEEQKDIVSKFYYDWKGNYEQVDDILIMGIKV
jgi:ligand-binding sensor domain-containing protein/serine phosphatase RsbU (regulator of sigma subunit)